MIGGEFVESCVWGYFFGEGSVEGEVFRGDVIGAVF